MIVEDIKVYDGNLLHNRFAYSFFRNKVLPIGNIIAYRAPMKVETEGMIDREDVLNNEFIYSDDAINFLWEMPGIDTLGAIAYQRLFNTNMANILSSRYLKKPIEVDGDDLIVHAEHEQHGIIQPKGKCSVSITHVKDGAALGHTGINIKAGRNAPSFAYSTNLDDEQARGFMNDVVQMFYEMNDDMFVATTKIISK
jgi:hypothetical protein